MVASSTQILGGITPVIMPKRTYKAGSSFYVHLMSDLHIGAPTVNYRLIQAELEIAKQNGWRVMINGDVFDAIITKDAKRFSPTAIHSRLHGRDDILNAAVDWAFEILSPYAEIIDMIGVGNHETSIEKYGSVDLVAMLIDKLKPAITAKDHVIHHGGYCGIVRYSFQCKGGNSRQSLRIFYHHGSGGASPVSQGLPNLFRMGNWVEGVDIIWTGHTHNRVTTHDTVMSMDAGGNIVAKQRRNIVTGAYMDTYGQQTPQSIAKHGRRGNYAADRAMKPGGAGRGGAACGLFTRHQVN